MFINMDQDDIIKISVVIIALDNLINLSLEKLENTKNPEEADYLNNLILYANDIMESLTDILPKEDTTIKRPKWQKKD